MDVSVPVSSRNVCATRRRTEAADAVQDCAGVRQCAGQLAREGVRGAAAGRQRSQLMSRGLNAQKTPSARVPAARSTGRPRVVRPPGGRPRVRAQGAVPGDLPAAGLRVDSAVVAVVAGG